MPTRGEFKQLARLRLGDAETLYVEKRYAGAYYICGLAVECGIKAIIAGRFKRHDIPEKELVQSIYSHSFTALIEIARLKPQLDAEMKDNEAFFASWNVVKDWSINCRYNCAIRKIKARDMLSAVNDPTNGVIPWLRRRW